MELRLHLARTAGLSLKCPRLPVALGSLRNPPGQVSAPQSQTRRCAALPARQTPRAAPRPSLPRVPPARAGWSRPERCPPRPRSHPGRAPTCPAGPRPAHLVPPPGLLLLPPAPALTPALGRAAAAASPAGPPAAAAALAASREPAARGGGGGGERNP